MPKKDGTKNIKNNGRVEFNRGFYLASCFESINSKMTLLIDDITVIMCHYVFYDFIFLLFPTSQLDTEAQLCCAFSMLELMKKFLIN
jgi:hypothetical protein